MNRLLIMMLCSLLLAGCATTPPGGTPQPQATKDSEILSTDGTRRFNCYSITALSLTADLLTIDCRNPKGMANETLRIAADSPVAIGSVLNLIALKLQHNQLPNDAPGLLDTLSETKDLINLKFKDSQVEVMVLELLFAEENPYHLLALKSRIETLGDSGVQGLLE